MVDGAPRESRRPSAPVGLAEWDAEGSACASRALRLGGRVLWPSVARGRPNGAPMLPSGAPRRPSAAPRQPGALSGRSVQAAECARRPSAPGVRCAQVAEWSAEGPEGSAEEAACGSEASECTCQVLRLGGRLLLDALGAWGTTPCEH